MTDGSGSQTKALVLGGGGVAGIAWEVGVLAGLLEHGIPVDEADLVVGTSAGSVVAATLRFGLIPRAFEQQLVPVPDAPGDGGSGGFDGAGFFEVLENAAKGAASVEEARARVGVFARAVTGGESEEVRIARFAERFPTDGWPSGKLNVTAVDAIDGAFRLFDADSGVQLARAVAASCAVPGVWSPVTIEGRPYMDGGMRGGTNADVAAGYGRVLVLACFPEPDTSPLGPSLAEAVRALETSADVSVVVADANALAAFGMNPLLLSSRAPSAAAGRAQADAIAADIDRFWNAPRS